VPRKKVVPVAHRIPEFAGLHDPHVWFNVRFWMLTVSQVRDSLIALDPTHADGYKARTLAYLAKLDLLDKEVRKEVAKVPKSQRVLVTAHDAFSYFGEAYGFEVKADTGDVQSLVDFILARKIKTIFIDASVPRRNIQAVQEAARAKGWEVAIGGELFSDAMGDKGTKKGTYIGMVRHNIHTIVNALMGGESS